MLNALLANTINLYFQKRRSDWNVRDPKFFARPGSLDRLRDHLDAMTNTLAERIGAVGGAAHDDVRASGATYSDDCLHVRALVDRYSALTTQLRRALWVCADQADPISEDILTETLRVVEQDMGFVRQGLVGVTFQQETLQTRRS